MNPTHAISNIKPSYIRTILKTTSQDNMISFAGGLPSPETFPMEIIGEVMPSMAADRELFQYTETAGYRPLTEDLRQRYNVPDTHDIIITSGSQQGLDICTRTMASAGDTIVTEEPSYLGALQIFSIVGATVRGVKQEHDGPNLAQLEALFQAHDVHFFYAVPDFHNPTGCCWSLEKRQAVAALCRSYQVLLIEDAPYRPIRFRGESLPMVSSFCPDESIALYSFSKIIAPGLRVAAIISPKRLVPALTVLKQATDLHTSVPVQKLLLEILNHPEYEQHTATTKQLYRQRYEAMAAELNTLPHALYHFEEVEGGMFIWLSIPSCDVAGLAAALLNKGVAVVPGEEFYTDVPCNRSALRLNFTHSDEEQIKVGMSRLKETLLD